MSEKLAKDKIESMLKEMNCRDCYYHDPFDGEESPFWDKIIPKIEVVCHFGLNDDEYYAEMKKWEKEEPYDISKCGKVVDNTKCKHFKIGGIA